MRAYLIENEIRFVNGKDIGYSEDLLIEDREFTVDELKYPVVIDKKISVNVDLKSSTELKEAREKKKIELKRDFENALITGKFMSTVLGIEVDCRRGGTYNDLQNLESLVSVMEAQTIQSANFVGSTKSKLATIQNLKDLIIEMKIFGYNLYQNKFTKDSLLLKANTIQKIDDIVW